MTPKPSGIKGYEFEEVLRNYFLKANFYVLRSLPLKIEGEDLTDIDIWLYERPSGFARRRLIVDAKFKTKPKAAERLVWTKGISNVLQVDDAYVATTDSRSVVRQMARRIGVGVLDGTDLGRIAASNKIGTPERLTEEEMAAPVRVIDRTRLSRDWALQLEDAKSSILEDFGVASGNRCLSGFSYFAEQAAIAYPNSPQAEVAVRAAFLTASMAVVSLDYVANEAAFRTSEERKYIISNGIRFGNIDREAGLEKVRVAMALVSQFVENGTALAHQISNRYSDETMRIPAEIVADQVARMSQKEALFMAARELESAAYHRDLEGFDALPSDAKSLIAAFLDFAGVTRSKFANAFTASNRKSTSSLSETPTALSSGTSTSLPAPVTSTSDGLLFDPSVALQTSADGSPLKKSRADKQKKTESRRRSSV